MRALEATRLLPNLFTIHPVKGRESIDPTGKANSTKPKAVSVMFKCCWMLGILEAHVANDNPNIKNKLPIAIL